MRFLTLALLLVTLGFMAPQTLQAQTAATVTCKDGSSDQGGRGACRGHGGVDKKAPASTTPPAATKSIAPAKAAPASTAVAKAPAAPVAAIVTCKDGSSDQGGRGACRGHGGVNKSGAPVAAAPAVAPAPVASAPVVRPVAVVPAPVVRPAAAPAAAPVAAVRPAPAPIARAAVPANAQNTDPTGAIARCKDNTYSHSKGHTGACSRHGGVEQWLDKG